MKIKYLLITILVLLLSGCHNYNELNDLAIVSAIGIDIKDDNYIVTTQVVNTQKNSSTSGSSSDIPKFIIYTGEGKTVEEALKNINYTIPKKIYVNHLQTLVISEDLAKEGIENILDYLFRNIQMRDIYNVLISKNTSAKKIIETLVPSESINAKDLSKILENNMSSLSTTTQVTMKDILNNYLNDKIEIIIPSVSLIGNTNDNESTENIKSSEANSRLKIDTVGIFKGSKLKGYLTADENLTLNIITNNVDETIITYQCKDQNYLVAELINNSADIKFDEEKKKFIIKVKSKGNFEEINCDLDIEDHKVIDEINKNLGKEIKNIINKNVNQIITKYNSDVFGFQDIIYKNNNDYYKKIKDNWEEEFKNLKYEIEVEVNIATKGNGLKVIK